MWFEILLPFIADIFAFQPVNQVRSESVGKRAETRSRHELSDEGIYQIVSRTKRQ